MQLSEEQAGEVSPLVLAYVGDAVWELFIRSGLAADAGAEARVKQLHRRAATVVNAEAQAKMAHSLVERLTPDEQNIIRRGRNAKPGHTPKGAGPCEYRYSTGFEALLGFLYLTGQELRLAEVLRTALELSGQGGSDGVTVNE